MPIWIRRLNIALSVLFAMVASPSPAGASGDASSAVAPNAGARARVVLIGEAGRVEALPLVLSELLHRSGVAADFEREDRFRRSALLSENSGDARVWVFIAQSDRHRARLFFRGPFGERFLLRTLTLKNGLDELGRELIAQVVETSTVALLRSKTGLSRDEVKADLSGQEGDAADEPESDDAAPPLEPSGADRGASPDAGTRSRTLTYELTLRGVAKWTGSDLGLDHGVGAETAIASRLSRSIFLRGRLSFEYGFGQTIESTSVLASVRTTALRAGAEIEFSSGSSSFAIGLGGGADVVRISPRAARSTALAPAADSTSLTPVVRAEARYRLTLGAFCVTASVLADASLVDTHYDVQSGGGAIRIAEPWPVRPGIGATVGWCPTL